jgi:hypothetical protein
MPKHNWTTLFVGHSLKLSTGPCRHRLPRLALIACVIALGLGSRRFGHSLTGFAAAYAGDTLWSLVAFLGIGLILPRFSTWRVAALAMSFSVMIEVSQLYHAPWIDSIRGTTLGALVLGHGFLWSDLACYAVGVGLGVLVEGVWPSRLDVMSPSPTTSSDHRRDHPKIVAPDDGQ